MILDFILQPITDVVNTVIKRFAPAEKMSEEQAARFAHEIQLELVKQNWSALEMEFKDRDSARQLAAADVAKGNAFTNFLAAAIRPMFGFTVLVVFVLMSVGTYFGLPKLEITQTIAGVMETVIGFYFGMRTGEKAMSMYTTMKAKQ